MNILGVNVQKTIIAGIITGITIHLVNSAIIKYKEKQND